MRRITFTAQVVPHVPVQLASSSALLVQNKIVK
jgi:hypothetical protein